MKETALESTRLQAAAAQKYADELTFAAEEKQREADTKSHATSRLMLRHSKKLLLLKPRVQGTLPPSTTTVKICGDWTTNTVPRERWETERARMQRPQRNHRKL